MTLFFAVSGVDQGNTTVRLEDGIVSLAQGAHGGYETATVVIDDAAGVLSYINLQYFTVIETACVTRPRVYTGYIRRLTVARHPKEPQGRIWTLNVADLNYLLHLQPARVASASRPAETGSARLSWLMALPTGLSGLVYDDGLVAANTALFDEEDDRSLYPDDIIANISINPSSGGGLFFVYWNQSLNRPSLFYNTPTAATNDSTLRLSNVRADVDDIDSPTAVTFAPNMDSEVEGAGEQIYCGVLVISKAGRTYRHNQTTHDAFGFGTDFHLVSVQELDRIGRVATAEAHADLFLTVHSGQIDTITCTVRLPASKVNMIEAGMRLSIKFSHLPGYTAFTWVRVQKREMVLTEGTNEYYDVKLELSTAGVFQLGGGNPGTFPQPPCPDAHYYSGVITDDVPQFGGSDFPTNADHTATWAHDTTYNWQIDVLASTVQGSGFAVFTVQDVASGHLWVNFAPVPLGVSTGSFATGAGFGTGGNMLAALTVIHNDTSLQMMNISFHVDPAGWVADPCPPPAPGQWVYGETPTPAPGGGRRLFFTAFPYATGSLQVFVDQIDQTAAVTETNPATGSFTLAFDPRASEVVTVNYQGV